MISVGHWGKVLNEGVVPEEGGVAPSTLITTSWCNTHKSLKESTPGIGRVRSKVDKTESLQYNFKSPSSKSRILPSKNISPVRSLEYMPFLECRFLECRMYPWRKCTSVLQAWWISSSSIIHLHVSPPATRWRTAFAQYRHYKLSWEYEKTLISSVCKDITHFLARVLSYSETRGQKTQSEGNSNPIGGCRHEFRLRGFEGTLTLHRETMFLYFELCNHRGGLQKLYGRRYFTSSTRDIGISFQLAITTPRLVPPWLWYCHCAKLSFHFCAAPYIQNQPCKSAMGFREEVLGLHEYH